MAHETDDGPIIIQAAVPVLGDDTPETLAARVLEQEHRIYPEAVRLIAFSRVRVVGSKVIIRNAAPALGAMINPGLS
ncbi:MAG: hypothetical protein H3C28_05750 [Sphingomonadales bacterium]|nr:hypothetical protein [Sphingomonadales bacterium]